MPFSGQIDLTRMLYRILFLCLASQSLALDDDEFVFVKRGPVADYKYTRDITDSDYTKLQESLSRSFRAIQTTEDLENVSKFARTVGRYFDFENGGQTWLGNFLQELAGSNNGTSQLVDFLGWKGDLLEPLAILGLSFLSTYTALTILGTIAPSVLALFSSTFSSINSILATALQSVWDQLVLLKDYNVDAISNIISPFLGGEDGDDPVVTTRRRRALDGLSNSVQKAITKYQNSE